jgi:glycine cleavage system transcriptional repressor
VTTSLAVTALGADRPGIVAAVTGALVEAGCNLEDTSMSILRGHFAMVLIVAAPEQVDAAGLEARLVRATAALDLSVSVREAGPGAGDDDRARERWTVVVYGADRPGIVHGITSVLAALDVNVVDLTTRVTEGIYAMVIEVALPPSREGSELEARLTAAAAELGVECTVHPDEADIL